MKKALKYLVYLGCFHMLVTCKQKHSNVQDTGISKTKKDTGITEASDPLRVRILGSKTFSYDDEFTSGLYKVVITTYYINDTLSDVYAWEAVSWPIVGSQKIQFMYKDLPYANFDFPTKKISRQTKKGKSVKSAEIIIWNANLIKGQKADLFGIFEAAALCVGAFCPTYQGVFDLSGKPVYQVYSYGPENHTLIIGNGIPKNGLTYKVLGEKLDSIQKIYGVSNEIMYASYKSQRKIGVNK
jgi:hypothetical protein